MSVSLLAFFAFVGTAFSSKLYVLDISAIDNMSPQDSFETGLALSSLLGIVNRDAPQMFVFYTDVDQSWLQYCQQHWPYVNSSEIVTLSSVDEAFEVMRESFHGAVVFDTSVPSTSNVAATISGVEDLIPVAKRSNALSPTLYDRLSASIATISPPPSRFVSTGRWRTAIDLTGRFNGSETGSSKNDAYRWAIREYVDTNRSPPPPSTFTLTEAPPTQAATS